MVMSSSREEQSHRHNHRPRPNQSKASPNPVISDGDEFPRSVAKTAVAQLCESAGFHSIQLSALETLADIATRYLCDVGKASQFYANLSGRSQSNAIDVISALEDIGGGGTTEIQASMAISKSVTLAELHRYVEYGEEIPFCKPVPHFPVCKRREGTPTFAQLGEKVPEPHIPIWLPAFPDIHTYKSTPVWNERKKDPKLDKLEQARQRRKAERSLVSLHLRLCNNNNTAEKAFGSSSAEMVAMPPPPPPPPSFGASSVLPPQQQQQQEATIVSKSEALDGTSRAKNNRRPGPIATENPFLATPLMSDTIKISSVPELLPFGSVNQTETKKNQIMPMALPSALDTFTPALEAARHDVHETMGGVSEPLLSSSSSLSRRFLLPDSKDRMPILMTWDFGGKAKEKGTAASLSLRTKDRKKPRKNQVKIDDKDEKKRRAEQILAQTVEEKEYGAQ